MGDVHRMPAAVTHRLCPGCGFRIDQNRVDMMRFDAPFPRCGEHQISKFQPLNWRKASTGGGDDAE